MPTRTFRLIAVVHTGEGLPAYRVALIDRPKRPDDIGWEEMQRIFNVDDPSDWKNGGKRDINEARRALAPLVRAARTEDRDVEDEAVRYTVFVKDQSVRFDS